MNPKNNLFINLAISFAAAALFLVAVEAVLRLTLYDFKSYARSPGPNSVYIIETAEFKTAIRTNSLNIRDYEIAPKKDGEYRVLCLGDSFTFGLGVNVSEAYPKAAQRILTQEGHPVSVINGGTQGNLDDAHKFLTEKGFGFRPDLVTLQVYIGNDFYDWLNKLGSQESAMKAQSETFETPRNNLLLKAKEFLKGTHWCTLEFVWNRLVQFPLVDDWFYRLNLRYDNRGIFLRKYPPLEKKLARLELEGLEKVQDLCNKEKTRLLVILVPTKQQLSKKHFLNNEKYFYKKPNYLIKNFCERRGIYYIDMLDVYETLLEKEIREFYYSQDRHWTVQGHASMGRVLADFVRRTKFGEPGPYEFGIGSSQPHFAHGYSPEQFHLTRRGFKSRRVRIFQFAPVVL